MSTYRPSDAYVGMFVTSSPVTLAAINADALPVATAIKNGTDDGAFTLTVANIDTGRYNITGTIPSGYVSGDVLSVSVAATIGGIAAKAIVDSQVIDSKRNSDLDTLLVDIPTSAELATALSTADDAVLTAIGDIPTNAELATALGTADDAVLAAVSAISTLLTSTGVVLTIAERLAIADATFTRSLGTESYAAQGAVPTLAQGIFMLLSALTQFAVAGLTITTKQLNGTTTAMTYTLDHATSPTSRVRAT